MTNVDPPLTDASLFCCGDKRFCQLSLERGGSSSADVPISSRTKDARLFPAPCELMSLLIFGADQPGSGHVDH